MAKPNHIDLPDGTRIPILFENRSLLILDKPAGWVLTPDIPVPGRLNLQLALESSMRAGDFWASSRNLRFLRFVHRLDADTSGALMFGKTLGALRPLSGLFAARRVEKLYLTVTDGVPQQDRWVCRLPLGPDPAWHGRHRLDRDGKAAETHFQVLQRAERTALVLVRPVSGRTHQIRVHLLANATPVLGDRMYARAERDAQLSLRSIKLAFTDPFQRRPVSVSAPIDAFVRRHGFDLAKAEEQIRTTRFDPPQPLNSWEDEEEEDTEEEPPASSAPPSRTGYRGPPGRTPVSGTRPPGKPWENARPARESAGPPRARPAAARRPSDTTRNPRGGTGRGGRSR